MLCSVIVCDAVALPFNCDFETDTICEMQLSTASNLDWTRRFGRASEQNTGPSGAQSGSYYMLVDSSVNAAAGHRAMFVYDMLTSSQSILTLICCIIFYHLTFLQNNNKKLITRWDNERELSLWRHRTRTTEYNRLVHKFRTDRRGYVLKRMFTKFSEMTQCNGHYSVQGHSRSPILIPIEAHIRLPISH